MTLKQIRDSIRQHEQDKNHAPNTRPDTTKLTKEVYESVAYQVVMNPVKGD